MSFHKKKNTNKACRNIQGEDLWTKTEALATMVVVVAAEEGIVFLKPENYNTPFGFYGA